METPPMAILHMETRQIGKGDLMVFRKGNIPWNRGKKTGQTSWNKGFPSELQPFFGRKHTNESKKKISDAHKGKQRSEETKRKISKKLRNKKDTLETRMKKSLAQMGHPYRGGSRSKGYKMSEESKQKISMANKGRKHTEETKKKIAISARRIRLNRPPFPKKDTLIERILCSGLDTLETKYAKHVSVCGVCQPDIVFSKLRIAVFADGDYWHSKEFKNGKVWKRDRNQDKTLRENGWKVLRFWGSQIKNNPKKCVNEIVWEVTRCQ